MKRIYSFPMALMLGSVAFLSGCSEEEEVAGMPQNSDFGEIRFATSTDLTRSKDITTTNLATFNVYAYTSSSDSTNAYMDNIVVTKSSSNVWSYSPVKYWPAHKSLDFYAFSPADWVGNQSPLSPVSYDVYPMSGGMHDIVYAVCSDLTGEADRPNPQVMLNFRHALSKVSVKFSSTNTNIKVMISSVAISNIMTKGNFIFPSETTSEVPSSSNVGKWVDQNTPMSYMLHVAQSASERITLGATPTVFEADGMGVGGMLYVMPQPLVWLANGTGDDDYIAVVGSIYDAKTNTKLWPNENTPKENIMQGSTFGDGIMKFPLLSSKFSEWHPGCHYIYNLVINANEEMGTIQFGTPSVDSFIDVETTYE